MNELSTPAGFQRGLHAYAVLLACCVVLLITAGALVTSRQAGLSVPDWPLSYGMLNPPGWWRIANVQAEHGHRLVAGMVALLTVALAVWVGRREPRRWVRRVAYLAVATVLAQAVLGGITVLLFLPMAVSVSHAGLAQLFLCLVVTVAITTSRWWRQGVGPRGAGDPGRRVAGLAVSTTVLIYFQVLLGAVMRHSGAGLAIPDFPLVFGGLVPPHFDFAIGIHYAHRVGAVVVGTAIFWTLGRVLKVARREPALVRPAIALAVLVLAQGILGAVVVLTGKAVGPNTLHVGTGALLLATGLVLSLTSRRLAWRVHRAEPSGALPLGEATVLREALS